MSENIQRTITFVSLEAPYLHANSAAPDALPAPYIATPVAEVAPVLPQPERLSTWRRYGNYLLRALGSQQERGTRAETAAPLLGRLTAKLETKTAKIEAMTELEEKKIAEQREAGDRSLLRSYTKYATIRHDQAARDLERFSRHASSCTRRAQRYQERGSLYGSLIGWLNRGLAAYFGWRARGAARQRDYYLEDVATPTAATD